MVSQPAPPENIRFAGGTQGGGDVSGNVITAAVLRQAGRWIGGAGAASGLLLVAACQGGAGGTAGSAAPPPASVTITTGNLTFSSAATGSAATGSAAGGRSASGRTSVPRAGSAVLLDKRPDLGVQVTASHGRLSSVRVTSAAGKSVAGSYASGASGWHTGWALDPARTYRVTATAVNSSRRRTVTTGTFRTMTPDRSFSATVDMGENETVGVGMPIMVTFSRPIKDRAEVERSFGIWSSKPVTGAWYWMSSAAAWFRPKHYWPAHTRVRFTAHLAGVQAAPGVYGRTNLSRQFRIGNSLVVKASTATHYMKVWWNGKLKGNWPISTGQPGDDTPNGHYLSIDMGNPVDMDSASFGVMPGDPGYYNVEVYDSVRFTWSGDYVHSAPWSVGEQGIVNVSHGCVNVAPDNAAWYYDHSVRGDPVTVVGSPLSGTWGDGWTIYFLSWPKLLAGSATGEAVMAGRDGSQFVPASWASPPGHPADQRVAAG